MSRLIVKNLPKKITEEKIRQLFEEKGTVTDIQLKYAPNGKFRQFAFIGYQTENEAEEAVKYFDKMFVNTSKIKVELCSSLGDSNKPKAWSKYAPDSTAFKKINLNEKIEEKSRDKKSKVKKTDETVELLSKYKDEPLFEEFLAVHAPQETEKLHKITSIENKEDSAIESGEDNEEEIESKTKKIADEKISDLEYMKKLMKNAPNTENTNTEIKKDDNKINLFTVKLHGLPYKCKKKDIKHFFKPVTPFTIRIPVKIHGIAYVGFKNEKNHNKALLKDRSFINGKRISVTRYSSNKDKGTESDSNFKNQKWKNQEEALKNEEDIAESGRIFFRNLSYTTVEDDIEKLFSPYGPLAEVNLPVDSETRKIKGFGTVTFLMPEHAVKAYGELDGTILHGRMLHLLPAKNKDDPIDPTIKDGSNFKQKKAMKQKSQAGLSHNWNSLFLGHDAVAEIIADTYGKSKEDVLAPHADGSAAVRLALGETQIVAQTRKYLEQEGVVLDAFNSGSIKRSKTVILVKNLPSQTQPKEIRILFEKFGVLGRIILPPSGITAIVEFVEPSEAKKAFSKLAYSKFKNAPLYLEWAPDNSLSSKPTKSEVAAPVVEKKETENNHLEEKVEEIQEPDEEPEPDTTLFVKNLNFKTTNESLQKHFESCGKICYASVATKKDKENPNNKLSMGYGFVRFFKKSASDKALKDMQQSVLDGKSLELKRSERILNNEINTSKKSTKITKQTGTKILVRNIPFQANSKEIKQLFSVFGEIKALRLPKKMTLDSGSHRGFCFVDFVSSSNAKEAFEALSQSTHLYGRRLVLEWATTDEGVEEIRKRTADHFTTKEEVKSKKSVFSMD